MPDVSSHVPRNVLTDSLIRDTFLAGVPKSSLINVSFGLLSSRIEFIQPLLVLTNITFTTRMPPYSIELVVGDALHLVDIDHMLFSVQFLLRMPARFG